MEVLSRWDTEVLSKVATAEQRLRGPGCSADLPDGPVQPVGRSGTLAR
jgi:hypothetical protein